MCTNTTTVAEYYSSVKCRTHSISGVRDGVDPGSAAALKPSRDIWCSDCARAACFRGVS